MQQIVNEIHSSIEVTTDYGDQKVPIIDLGVWLANDAPYFLLHEYYHKELTPRAVISVRSAVPWQAKRTILTQEIL